MSKIKTQLKQNKQPRSAVKKETDALAWQDCTWKRVPCGRDECPICGRIRREREDHIARGEDPDSIEAAIADVDNYFQETFLSLSSDIKRQKISPGRTKGSLNTPPPPLEFILYNKVLGWRDGIYKIADESDDTSSTWLFTEAGEDLLWYANTLLAKIYRQLANRWRMEKGENPDEEYAYTGRVLAECLRILKGSLGELSAMNITQKKEFGIARLFLTALEREIISI